QVASRRLLQQRALRHERKQLLGIRGPRQRPKPRAGSAGQNHWMDLRGTLVLELGEIGIGENIHAPKRRSRIKERPVITLCCCRLSQSSLRGSTMAIERPPPIRLEALT